jgi:hypothetical protein
MYSIWHNLPYQIAETDRFGLTNSIASHSIDDLAERLH